MYEVLYLDKLPDYISFEFQATQADGTKFDPTGTPTVSIYEEGGANATYDNSQIVGSPFNMAKINAKTGNYGVLVDKTLFTVGNLYRVLYEATVDGVATAKIEVYQAMNWSDLVDDIWDEVLTGVTHNIATSSGKRLRDLSSTVVRQAIAQGPGTGTNQIQLDAGASAVDGSYDPSGVAIIDGTGVGQSRLILEYDGATRTATVDRDWKVVPDATSEYVIFADPGRENVNEGLIQSATASTVTLNTLASASNDAYVNQIVFIRAGTGADQTARVTSYDGGTKIADISPDWIVIPDSTSSYVMLPSDSTSDVLDAISASETAIIAAFIAQQQDFNVAPD